jgi:hypothetical protein
MEYKVICCKQCKYGVKNARGLTPHSYWLMFPVERHDSPGNAATVLKYPAATIITATVLTCLEVVGSNLGKQVIAEGIENAKQRYFLLQTGCIEGQGYLFGKPMPLAAFNKLPYQ